MTVIDFKKLSFSNDKNTFILFYKNGNEHFIARPRNATIRKAKRWAKFICENWTLEQWQSDLKKKPPLLLMIDKGYVKNGILDR